MAFPKLTEEQMTQLVRYAGASTKTFARERRFFARAIATRSSLSLSLVNSKSSILPATSPRRSVCKALENLPATLGI